MDNAQRTATLSRGKGKGLLKSILPAFLLTLLLGACLLLLAAFILSRTADPTKWIRTVGLALPAVCAFFGGFTAGKREKNMGAPVGLCTGVLFLLFLLVLSAATGGATASPLMRVVCYTLLLLLSTLGGAAGSTGGSKKSTRHRRRKR